VRQGLGHLAWLSLLGAALACGTGCHRGSQALFVTAPFNDETRIAKVTAQWQIAPATPGDGETVHVEVRVENQLADRLYVKLEGLELVDARGAAVVSSDAARACVLGGQETANVLSLDLRLARGSGERVSGFGVERFGAPLSERGRGIYREFLIQTEGRTPEEADAELNRYSAAGPCS